MFYTVGSDADGNLVILTDAAETCGGLTKISLPPGEAEGLVRQAAFLLQTQRLPTAIPALPLGLDPNRVPFSVDRALPTEPAPAPASLLPSFAPLSPAAQLALDAANEANATAEAMALDAANLRAKAGGAQERHVSEAQRKAEEERDIRRAKMGGKNE